MSPASTAQFAAQTYVFDPRPAYPLQLAAKRYFVPGSPNSNSHSNRSDADAPTLVFAHGTGYHKELWEPVMDDLAALVDGQDTAEGKARVVVGDMWAVDCPNHGDSAALNAAVLEYGYEQTFGWEEYARVLHLLMNGHGRLRQTGGVDQRGANFENTSPFVGRRVIGVGHSMGSVGLALSLTYAPSPTNSFAPHPAHPLKSLILVEPMIMQPAFALGEATRLIAGAERRRDAWPSRTQAREALGRSLGKQGWEGRCVRSYLEYGLKPVEGGDAEEDGPVTLKCSKIQEAACYRDPLGPIRLYASFGALVDALPVHVMYGAVDDYLPAAVKTDIVEHQAGGVHNFASFARVPGGGHLVPYQSPTALAEKIFDALRVQARVREGGGVTGRSKL
ncbi:hypothetical protein D9619_009673 [Psilocybe cf. subviscida]|uniref:AB hydrolase-1 domain-containing protein n=1 Tax=Psilocybe cf. subviscida TaxID=2480587 RepID=A0A8H5BLL0_9AGAR|nr:hypothetical protein D9619_009673 [Psilocybe cf. subviscida]